jgi:hypothetical protein
MDSCADDVPRHLVRMNGALLTIRCNPPSLGADITGATLRPNSARNFFARMSAGAEIFRTAEVAAK